MKLKFVVQVIDVTNPDVPVDGEKYQIIHDYASATVAQRRELTTRATHRLLKTVQDIAFDYMAGVTTTPVLRSIVSFCRIGGRPVFAGDELLVTPTNGMPPHCIVVAGKTAFERLPASFLDGLDGFSYPVSQLSHIEV